MEALKRKLLSPKDAFAAKLFLRFFGLVIILQTFSYLKADFIESGLLPSRFLFTYDFFSWIKLIPKDGLNFLMLLLFLSGILLILQKLVFPSLLIFIGCFLYLFLVDKSYYNNHFYLLLLVAFLFCFYKPIIRTGENRSYIPYLFILVLQLQVVLVYFYGGVAKLNTDWILHQQPVRILLGASAKTLGMPGLGDNRVLLYLITYGGLVFDLCIGFLLWIKSTRKAAILLIFIFNTLNFFLFNFGSSGDIGIFPIFMMGSTILFMEPDKLRSYFSFLLKSPVRKKEKKKRSGQEGPAIFQYHPLIWVLCSLYVGLQCLLPLRHLLYAGNTGWTAKANRFAWRMKVNSKASHINFYIRLTPGDSLRELNTGKFINSHQEYVMGEDPVMVWQFARFLKQELGKQGFLHPEIFTSTNVSLNNRPFYPVIDSTVNLLELKHHRFLSDSWILPLPEDD